MGYWKDYEDEFDEEMYDSSADYVVADTLEIEEFEEDTGDSYVIEAVSDGVPDDFQEDVDIVDPNDVDYDAIYEGIEQEALEEGIKDCPIDADPELLDERLSDFTEENWENQSMDDHKESMGALADYIIDTIGFENPPKIEYYNNPEEGDFGYYSPDTNTLSVNEYMLYDSDEAADTIAHELWHAHQHERADHPQNARDYQYQYNFENYIPASLDHEAYEDQLVEAEARAFAAQFKGRLAQLKGGE